MTLSSLVLSNEISIESSQTLKPSHLVAEVSVLLPIQHRLHRSNWLLTRCQHQASALTIQAARDQLLRIDVFRRQADLLAVGATAESRILVADYRWEPHLCSRLHLKLA